MMEHFFYHNMVCHKTRVAPRPRAERVTFKSSNDDGLSYSDSDCSRVTDSATWTWKWRNQPCVHAVLTLPGPARPSSSSHRRTRRRRELQMVDFEKHYTWPLVAGRRAVTGHYRDSDFERPRRSMPRAGLMTRNGPWPSNNYFGDTRAWTV